jgi:hypothetical protein
MRVLFLSAAFIAAFLLFCVQPMIAKMVLPQFGGAPAVWNTCLVFFQAALLAGYAMAHAGSRWLNVRRQAVLQLGLLALPIAVLPIAVRAGVASVSEPALRLLGILLPAVGPPFFVIATTAPLLQRWFATTGHRRAADPYFLYAASNLGSLVALVGYVTLIEPNLTLGNQARLWAAGYAILAGLIVACAGVVWRAPASAIEAMRSERVNAGERARWVALAFVPSSLLMGVTTYLTTDLAPVPLLWVVPLTLYLLSFIIAFASPPAWVRRSCALALAPAVVATLAIMAGPSAVPNWTTFLVHLTTFFLAATACHAELAHRRPPASHLTEFYLMISLGGLLGGLFNALIAPVIFTSVAEYPLVLALAVFLVPAAVARAARRGRFARVLDVVLPLLLGLASDATLRGSVRGISPSVSIILSLAACLLFVTRPLRFALALAIVAAVIAHYQDTSQHVAFKERSFFGILRVLVNFPKGVNTLMHGKTIHGMQRRSLDVSIRSMPLSYYFPTGPVGQVFDSYQGTSVVEHVGVIGLGVGSLASYGKEGQEFTFFEIDPTVARIARAPAFFRYLDDCQAHWRVILGDARLSLYREPDGAFGLIVLDAFSGDAIPMHLLTREALQIYLAKLAHGGLIALHISNAHLDLLPAVGALARDAGLAGQYMDDTNRPISRNEFTAGRMHSQWVVLARRGADLARIPSQAGWRPLADPSTRAVWTDDYSNLLGLLRW